MREQRSIKGGERGVKDLMIPLTDYPHIPYWFTIKQAVSILKKAAEDSQTKVEPWIVLVFDEKYQLMGLVGLRDLLRGIEPRFLRRPEAVHFQGAKQLEADTGLAILWKDLFGRGSREEANKPVSEVMVPIRATLNATDPIAKAVYVMVQTDMEVLPVMEGGKVVGIIRMIDIFKDLTAEVLGP